MAGHDHVAEFFALETSLLRPHVRRSAEQLDELLDEDFEEFTASGGRCDKLACLEALPREPAAEFEIKDFVVRVLAPAVVLATYRLTRVGERGRSQSLRSSIWRFVEGDWRLTFHQGTPALDG